MTDVHDIPFITISYNSAELIEKLISSIRNFYTNKIYIIDGSEKGPKEEIKQLVDKQLNAEFISFDYNIHHGPGMAWAIKNLPHSGQALFLDSDMEIIHGGFLERMHEVLGQESYGVGRINKVNREGFDVHTKNNAENVDYLHPALMLCNLEVMRKWPLPIKHGAPMIDAMLGLHDSNNSHLLKHLQWVDEDVVGLAKPNYVLHLGRGTVIRTGGYHLDEWMNSLSEKQSNTNGENLVMKDYQFTNKWFDGAARANWDILIPQIQPKKLLEIGSYEGASACYLIDTLASQHDIELHCIDTWSGGIEHQEGGTAETNMHAVEDRFHANMSVALSNKDKRIDLKIHKGASDKVLSKLIAEGKDNYFDFVYIDGSHQAPDVLTDAVLGFKLLKVGGVMAFDDYLWAEKPVTDRSLLECPKPAIDSFLNIYFNKMSVISAPLYQIYAQKTSN
jgi:predicted O-methyltransferase YrrM